MNQEDCIRVPYCSYQAYVAIHYPRYDCPRACDDGCIYFDDCAHGTPIPDNFPPPGLVHSHIDPNNALNE